MKAAVEPVSQPVTPARQRSKPLMSVGAAKSVLDITEGQVLRLIEDGRLAYAFDVALDPNRGRNQELRILPACVAAYLRGQACGLEWAEVLRLLLPDNQPVLLAVGIARALNVTSEHVYHLIGRKLLVACSAWRRGRGGSARVTAKSFIGFLKARRVL